MCADTTHDYNSPQALDEKWKVLEVFGTDTRGGKHQKNKKRRRGWTPGRFGTYGSRTNSLIFTMKFNFSFFFLSFPFLFLISVFWFSCLGSPRASRHALGPAAIGHGGVLSFNLKQYPFLSFFYFRFSDSVALAFLSLRQPLLQEFLIKFI